MRLVDTRIVDKPGKFSGKAEAWRDWSETFVSFCSASDRRLGVALEKYSKLTEAVLMEDMSEEEKVISESLHYILVTLTRDKAADIRRNVVEKKSGLEVWRALCFEYEPQTENRFGGLLAGIINTKFPGLSAE